MGEVSIVAKLPQRFFSVHLEPVLSGKSQCFLLVCFVRGHWDWLQRRRYPNAHSCSVPLAVEVTVAKILMVEDDLDLAASVKDWLLTERHEVELLDDGLEALEYLKTYGYDVVVLDWKLPGMSGVEVCRAYRSAGGTAPILMLTGQTDIEDRATGLDSGADDYLSKPADPRELLARVRALLRRPAPLLNSSIKYRSLVFDLGARTVSVGGEAVDLRPRELALLEFLLRHRGRVFSAEELLNSVWSSDANASPDSVRVCVTRIRNKLDRDGEPTVIRNVYGTGYTIDN